MSVAYAQFTKLMFMHPWLLWGLSLFQIQQVEHWPRNRSYPTVSNQLVDLHLPFTSIVSSSSSLPHLTNATSHNPPVHHHLPPPPKRHASAWGMASAGSETSDFTQGTPIYSASLNPRCWNSPRTPPHHVHMHILPCPLGRHGCKTRFLILAKTLYTHPPPINNHHHPGASGKGETG